MTTRLVTITVPSSMHPTTMTGGHRRKNECWDGTTPGEACAWLQQRWRRARESMRRANIAFDFVIAVQAHLDGTPHWHIVIWTKGKRWAETEQILRRYFSASAKEGKARYKHGIDVREIEGGTEGAVAYISRVVAYISREVATEGEEQGSEATRTKAWSRTHRIQRFRTSRSAATIMKELRRRDIDLSGTDLEGAQVAARDGDYARLIEMRDELGIRPAYTHAQGKYGDLTRRLIGIQVENITFVRTHEWKIVQRDIVEPEDRAIIVEYQGGAVAISEIQSRPTCFNENREYFVEFAPHSGLHFMRIEPP
jgi:hypothetical protein